LVFEENIVDLHDAGFRCHTTNKPKARSRMSVETTHRPNEHVDISAQLDKRDVKIPCI